LICGLSFLSNFFNSIKSNISLFDHISIYNEVEQLNKHKQIFMTVLNKLIQRAGHELKFINVEKTEKKKMTTSLNLKRK
jgi:hypothetical protein